MESDTIATSGKESWVPTEAKTETNVSAAALFEPIRFGRVMLPNRIAMAPMTRSMSPGKVSTPEMAAYYRRRAEGGTGLIITEGTNPGHPAASAYTNVPFFNGEASLAAWKRVADGVHAAGGFIVPQLWHVGTIRKTGMEPDPNVPGWGPSAITHPALALQGDTEMPHEMTEPDIAETIAAFARSARHAQELGFDGVELHGAHSYIIDQFFWEATNKRADKYGGATLAERTRFAIELVEAVRAAVSDDFPVIFRFSQWKQGDYNHKMARTPAELEAFLTPLSRAGVDWFHCSTRDFNAPEFPGSDLNLAGWTKRLIGKPTITVGSVGLAIDFLHSYGGQESEQRGLDTLIRRLQNKEFDMVAVGRALLSDPDWANKIKAGHVAEVVPFKREHLSKLI
jgi:2,4-dienoyl-CoA reductase-like NADH-dependent reductase (Old Yellow Enzyme family)